MREMDGCFTDNTKYIGLRADFPTGVVIREKMQRETDNHGQTQCN